ncbi:MAG: hypothetical protein RBR45_14550, partial [Pseudomonas sp.]|nr:hypothetical protein [Pseudomonas sp.]
HVRVGHRQAYTAKPQISDGLGFFYASKKICIGGFNPSLKTAILTMQVGCMQVIDVLPLWLRASQI